MTDDHLLHGTRRLVGTGLLALATAASWWVWTAWDLRRDVDPVTGTSTGPWEAWQVAGVVLCLLAVVVAAARRLPAWLVVAVVPVTFTVAWSLTAASQDDSGLWAVGAVLVLLGTSAGTAVVAAVTAAFRRARAAPVG
ncbi:hypothetical protein EV383_3962 [Pseudonocardia sediminis]|uniref:Uncharacterized protein n=1 Tax=Pseudonocardia sediminis TaxID=1397368 RepID=A0A4Q7UYN6_PSEST|nr:hypothetical protein [Pseudonocardia sediminis]RZT87056.1 hypothetical protein EV383_3962 [Pseudonocardia sediminis]